MCRRDRLSFTLLVSAIFHELGLFLVAPTIDYRYSHWMVMATMVGSILLFMIRLRSPPVGSGLARAGDLR
jgi:hypothetical protein